MRRSWRVPDERQVKVVLEFQQQGQDSRQGAQGCVSGVVVQDGKARLVSIKTGRAHEGAMEVVEGDLKAGDTVVVTGNETLQDQAAVVVKEKAFAVGLTVPEWIPVWDRLPEEAQIPG